VFSFPIRNTGKISIPFEFYFTLDDSTMTNSSTINSAVNPFTVNPSSGTILAGESLLITIKFQPIEVDDYSLFLHLKLLNLLPGKSYPIIPIRGKSLRPLCHFELETKDYLFDSIQNLSNSLDPNTRVIEIETIGIKKIIKNFYILNPTSITYDFEWVKEGNEQGKLKCLTRQGTIVGGKKSEIIFEYSPDNIDVLETFWKFKIPSQNIQIPFMILCRSLEPSIYFDKTSVNFKSILVDCPVKESLNLVNQENIPFYFSFNDILNENSSVIQINPNSGFIAPKSEQIITVMFQPRSEKIYNYNLICNVRKKPNPLVINIKGEGYLIHEKVYCQNVDNSLYLLSNSDFNLIDFGRVFLNAKSSKRITIKNDGRFPFDFSWKIKGNKSNCISINPEFGKVGKDEIVNCDIDFSPTVHVNLKNVTAVCQISNGRQYTLSFEGIGAKPNLLISEDFHDFGPCFIFRPGMKPLEHRFKVTNKDEKEISLDVSISNSSAFEINAFGPPCIAPNASTFITVLFFPREATKYQEYLTVDINGLSKTKLTVSGEGVDMNLDLAHSDHKSIGFGAVRVGHVVSKTIKLVNKSIIPVKFNLGTTSVIEKLLKNFVTFSQTQDITIRPKGYFNLEFKFIPTVRVQPFFEEIHFECPGYSKPLFAVHGACHGIEVKIENQNISFGAVVLNSSNARKVQLRNVGDIGVKFKWDVSRFYPHFSITPSEGYISSGMEVPLEFTFHPKELDHDIRLDSIPCFIEGANPLTINLSGVCIPPTIQSEVLKFSTAVRESDVKQIPLTNKYPFTWMVKPVIDNEFWSCLESLEIESGQTKQLEIVYKPLQMTNDEHKHEGSIFIPLPDGSGMLFRLLGTADKPTAVESHTLEIPCKTHHVQSLKVQNWLKSSQRFKVVIEQAKTDLSVLLKGHSYIDIPPSAAYDYKLSYFAYKEGLFNVKVTFRNEDTGEYLFHTLQFKSTPPAVSAVYEMSTIARQPVLQEISILNPLPITVSFNVTCTHPDVSCPSQFNIAPRSEGICTVEFLPLQAKESSTRVTLSSNELGVYNYDLKLIATPAGPERSIQFKVSLGASQTQSFRFTSYAKSKIEYLCKIDSPDFTCEKSVIAPPALASGGVEVVIDVVYEPSKLGDTKSFLSVSSPQGGDYICPLIGHCIAPKPQGPFTIKAGSFASIPFKNVSAQTANFIMTIDNVNFTVKNQESIGSKKMVHINVNYKVVNSKAPKTAKMVVSQVGSNVQWIYYLKGI
ncbi:hypothetical protein ROZALSC1DRAFT_23958, partial [Rozella allomycis CSF55]